jgi:hypothetical protein
MYFSNKQYQRERAALAFEAPGTYDPYSSGFADLARGSQHEGELRGQNSNMIHPATK